MASKWAFIEANDVLMFRDSRPFTAGANFTARSTFPPHPRTMQGFIRTHILESAGGDYQAFASGNGDALIHKVVGGIDKFGELSITGPFVARHDPKTGIERFFRAPFDLLQNKEDESLSILQPGRQVSFTANVPFEGWRPLMKSMSGAGAEADGWLSETNFRQYLTGKADGKLLPDEAIYQTETRVGLELDYSARRGAPGMFYHAEFIRPINHTGLLVGIENDQNLFKSGTAYLGGEGRTARIEIPRFEPKSLITATEGRIKIVLLTPAWFTNGWQPDTAEGWSAWVGGGRLVSLAIGKPQLISGWDLARKEPRPIRHFLPAGSVFYFENATLTGKAFTEQPPDEDGYVAMGFGGYATAGWNYLD